MPNDGANNRANRGLITEGLLKKGGINSTPPSPKPAPPPGQPVQQSVGTGSASTPQSSNKGGG